MPIVTRGLHVTQYMEDCFSMSFKIDLTQFLNRNM